MLFSYILECSQNNTIRWYKQVFHNEYYCFINHAYIVYFPKSKKLHFCFNNQGGNEVVQVLTKKEHKQLKKFFM